MLLKESMYKKSLLYTDLYLKLLKSKDLLKSPFISMGHYKKVSLSEHRSQ